MTKFMIATKRVFTSLELGQMKGGSQVGRRIVQFCNREPEEVILNSSPPEIAEYRNGLWIEATTERDLDTSRLVCIVHCEIADETPLYSKEDRERFWNQR